MSSSSDDDVVAWEVELFLLWLVDDEMDESDEELNRRDDVSDSSISSPSSSYLTLVSE